MVKILNEHPAATFKEMLEPIGEFARKKLNCG